MNAAFNDKDSASLTGEEGSGIGSDAGASADRGSDMNREMTDEGSAGNLVSGVPDAAGTKGGETTDPDDPGSVYNPGTPEDVPDDRDAGSTFAGP